MGTDFYSDSNCLHHHHYFDFFENDKNQLNVVVGDVSGHGISSALLMASVRAFIRQRTNLPGSMSRTLFDVNQQLVIDVEETGNFMTLFHLKIDPVERRASWIRGGHDPAIFQRKFNSRSNHRTWNRRFVGEPKPAGGNVRQGSGYPDLEKIPRYRC